MRYKYPRTPHLPWSPGCTSDDKRLDNDYHFKGRNVVVTIKMDGENTTLYSDYMHARSIDSKHHSSRDWVKAFHSKFRFMIPPNWRICGENLYAKHTIYYEFLDSYFMLFSIWNDQNRCLSWEDTLRWANLIDSRLITTPVIYKGNYDFINIGRAYNTFKKQNNGTTEGYVIRVEDSFHYDEFDTSVAKYVRPNHVQTDKHWMHAEVTPNRLRK